MGVRFQSIFHKELYQRAIRIFTFFFHLMKTYTNLPQHDNYGQLKIDDTCYTA